MLTSVFFRNGNPRPLTTGEYAAARGLCHRSAALELSALVRQGAVQRTERRGRVLFLVRAADSLHGSAPAYGAA